MNSGKVPNYDFLSYCIVGWLDSYINWKINTIHFYQNISDFNEVFDQSMLDEADGPMNFTQMVTLFAGKMAGGTDDDETILKSFEAFEINGQIDAEAFRHSLMTFGNKFSASEVDDAFAEFQIDGGMIDAAHLKGLMCSK